MARADHLDLNGAPAGPTVERAQVQYHDDGVRVALLAGLAFYGASKVFTGHTWGGQLGGGLALLSCVAGLFLWWTAKNQAAQPGVNSRYLHLDGQWFVVGLLSLKAWEAVRPGAALPGHRELYWPLACLLVLLIALLFAVQGRRKSRVTA